MAPQRLRFSAAPSPGWYIVDQDQRRGPYPVALIEQWVRSGDIPLTAALSDGTETLTVDQFIATRLHGVPVPAASPPSPAAAEVTAVSTSPMPRGEHETPLVVEPTAPAAFADRDRIVVLGRRQAGKTVYLAAVYAILWRSLNGLTAKAMSGSVHQRLMGIYERLNQGRWPEATLGTSSIELEIDYHGRRMPLVTLDFAGELFTRAFIGDQCSQPAVQELLSHIDRAAAVLLLLDPSVVAGHDRQAAMDDDFGMVQAIERLRNWPGGEHVPVAVVLTKMDQHWHLVDRWGGPASFLRRFCPALTRLLREPATFGISAVRAKRDIVGRHVPQPESADNVEAPLRHCLRQLQQSRHALQSQQDQDDQIRYQTALAATQQRRERRQNIYVALAVAALVLTGLAGLVMIVVART